ncbi:hypothetical protein ACSSS7_003804 [Eimeria intestinalis]
MVKKVELQQHAKYTCPFCGKGLHQDDDGWSVDAANRGSRYSSFHSGASEEADG